MDFSYLHNLEDPSTVWNRFCRGSAVGRGKWRKLPSCLTLVNGSVRSKVVLWVGQQPWISSNTGCFIPRQTVDSCRQRIKAALLNVCPRAWVPLDLILSKKCIELHCQCYQISDESPYKLCDTIQPLWYCVANPSSDTCSTFILFCCQELQ